MIGTYGDVYRYKKSVQNLLHAQVTTGPVLGVLMYEQGCGSLYTFEEWVEGQNVHKRRAIFASAYPAAVIDLLGYCALCITFHWNR